LPLGTGCSSVPATVAPDHPLQPGGRWRRLEQVSPDASNRCYCRLEDDRRRTAILVTYPEPVRPQLERDLAVLRWLGPRGVRVPEVLECDPGNGWLLVEDLGRFDAEQLLRRTPPSHRQRLLERTLQPLMALAAVPPAELPAWNAPLDRRRLRWELAGFELWFLSHWRDRLPTPDTTAWLDALAEEIAGHPRRVCHRDFHLNNLFLLPGGGVGVIDVQDVLVGPDTYDPASLLGERDAPRLLSPQVMKRWLERWAQATDAADGWQERWPRVRLQRALKVLGTFARLTLSGRAGYLPWLEALARDLHHEAELHRLPTQLVELLLD
jgi:aminoglycoside/choline kinase family phosphotransferase